MSEPTKMPEWMKRQFDSAEAQVERWSDGKREAAGIPRTMNKIEMPERIWVNEVGQYAPAPLFASINHEYRRIPSLPDVMEDGYVVMEWGDGNSLIVKVGNDDPFGVVGCYIVKSDCCGESRLGCAMREFLRLPVLAEPSFYVQNNHIVKVEG